MDYAQADTEAEPAPSDGVEPAMARFPRGAWRACAFALTVATALWLAELRRPDVALLAEARRCGVALLTVGAVLLPAAGLAGTAWLVRARRRGAGIGRAARWPQVLTVAPMALLAALAAWSGAPRTGLAADATTCAILGGGALLLAFPLLVAERALAAMPSALATATLPEASGLRALLMVPLLVLPVAGAAEIAAGLGLPATATIGAVLSAATALVGLELATRAAGRAFLPPPLATEARAAVTSALARLLADGAREGGIGAPLRARLGIDFSRSFALAYLRAAAVPMLLVLALLGWGLSGIVVLGLDQRGVYERFGAPVRVLHPGLHAILPWPLGQVRRVEFGAVHEVSLADAASQAAAFSAEDRPTAALDRLWEQAHPGEVGFLLASAREGRQDFQTVSADIRVQWRMGLTDAAARDAAYRITAPEALVRASASRQVVAFLAGRTLAEVLGERRDGVAAHLRDAVQADLDAHGGGIELTALVIEAIHPPAGAAEAYHNVQAAEIAANASVAAERGRASATTAAARQYATEITTQAEGAAAETRAAARAEDARFGADRAGAASGRAAFLAERYNADLAAALGRTPATIVDSRIPAGDAPVLDLRPPGAAPATGTSAGQE